MKDRWDLGYDLKPGEKVVLTRDVEQSPSSDDGDRSHFANFLFSRLPEPGASVKTFAKGTSGRVIQDEEGPHQSVNGVLAYVLLDGETKPVILCEGDFMPVTLVKQGDGGSK